MSARTTKRQRKYKYPEQLDIFDHMATKWAIKAERKLKKA